MVFGLFAWDKFYKGNKVGWIKGVSNEAALRMVCCLLDLRHEQPRRAACKYNLRHGLSIHELEHLVFNIVALCNGFLKPLSCMKKSVNVEE